MPSPPWRRTARRPGARQPGSAAARQSVPNQHRAHGHRQRGHRLGGRGAGARAETPPPTRRLSTPFRNDKLRHVHASGVGRLRSVDARWRPRARWVRGVVPGGRGLVGELRPLCPRRSPHRSAAAPYPPPGRGTPGGRAPMEHQCPAPPRSKAAGRIITEQDRFYKQTKRDAGSSWLSSRRAASWTELGRPLARRGSDRPSLLSSGDLCRRLYSHSYHTDAACRPVRLLRQGFTTAVIVRRLRAGEA